MIKDQKTQLSMKTIFEKAFLSFFKYNKIHKNLNLWKQGISIFLADLADLADEKSAQFAKSASDFF